MSVSSMFGTPGEVEATAQPRRLAALGVIGLAQLMVVLDASVVIVALPSAQRALHIAVADRQWVMTVYSLAFGSLLLLGGRIADYLGRRRMFVVSLLGFAGASALGGRRRTRRCSSALERCKGPSQPLWHLRRCRSLR